MGKRCSKSQAVIEADQRRYLALHKADIQVLEDILHENFYYTHFSGRTDTKAAYLDNLRSGHVRYGLGKTSNTILSIYGETAVMHGRMQMDCFTADNQHFPLDNIFTSVWVLSSGNWRIAAWASTAREGL